MSWISALLKHVPKNTLSYWVGKAVHQKLPIPLGPTSVRLFAKAYHINMDEAEKPIGEYPTVGALFTRKLKPGVRPIQAELVHPADSKITEFGVAADGILIQAKGKTYTIEKLLGHHDLAKTFIGGFFSTYYLCPTDYHRVHSPVTGQIVQSHHIPGELWPVNNTSVETVRELFAVNERVVTLIDTPRGRVAVVMVGATNVGKMTMTYDPMLVTNASVRRKKKPELKTYHPAIDVKAGDELGVFHMGSTVIMLYASEFFKEPPRLPRGAVKMGEPVVVRY